MSRFFLLFSIICFISPSAASALEIKFSPVAEVKAAFITLGDIVEFNEETPLSQALATKQISTAPKAGKSITLESKQVKSSILNNYPIDEYIIWKGAKSIIVERQGTPVTSQDMEAAIANYLEERKDSLPQADYSFNVRELPLPFVIPLGELQITVIPADPNVIGSRRFSLIYKVDGKTVKNISLRGKLEALTPVAILTRNVKRGAILHPDMVQMQIKDLSQLRAPCTDLREVLGKKITRSLRSGTVLNNSSIDFPPLIHKGQLVKILINHNGMHLTATGVASMNGKQDQIIRVMNSGSRKTILCKVSAPGLVEVQI